MKRQITLSIAAIITIAFGVRTADAAKYDDKVDLKGKSGTIVGKVLLDGKVPAPKIHEIKHKDKVCHTKPVPDETLVVNKDKGVRWAVVYIKKIKAGKPFLKEYPALDQKGCRFEPHVALTPVKKPLKVLNSDGVLHNVHVKARLNEESNAAMINAKPMNLTFYRKEFIPVVCDVHPWMGSWVIAMGHPYYVITAADGSFKLENVPAGTYKLRVWHEKLGKQEVEVTVAAGKEKAVEFKLKKSS